MARSRDRKPRKPRTTKQAQRLRFNPEAAGSPVTGPELLVLPVNPICLRWAADSYLTEEEAARYQNALREFIPWLQQQLGPETPDDLFITDEDGRQVPDEIAIGHAILSLPANLQDAQIVRQTWAMIGFYEELGAISPAVRHGVLSGDGWAPPEMPSAKIKDSVVSFDIRVQRAEKNIGYPVQRLLQSGSTTVAFAAMGAKDGLALLPPGLTLAAGRRVAAGIVRLMLVNRMFDVRAGAWAPGARLRFALPTPVYAGDQDLTRSTMFANFVAPQKQVYGDANLALALFFTPEGRKVEGYLREGEQTTPVSGLFSEKERVYVLQVGRKTATFAPGEKGAILTLEGKSAKQLPEIVVERQYPDGSGRFFVWPHVLGWLQSGVDELLRKPSDEAIAEEDFTRRVVQARDDLQDRLKRVPTAEEIARNVQLAGVDAGDIRWDRLVSAVNRALMLEHGADYELVLPLLAKFADEPLSDVQASRILGALRDAIPRLPIEFWGSIPGDDGVPRFLPAYGEGLSYYGDDEVFRSLAANRRSRRAILAGARFASDTPPSFAFLQLLGEAGDPRYLPKVDQLREIRADERFTLLGLAELSGREQRKAEAALFSAGEGKEWSPPMSLALTGELSICSMAFTLYGESVDGTYGVLWQSPIMGPAEIEAIMAAGRAQAQREIDSGVAPEEYTFQPVCALRSHLLRQSGILQDLGEAEFLSLPLALVGTVIVDTKRYFRGPPHRWEAEPDGFFCVSCGAKSQRDTPPMGFCRFANPPKPFALGPGRCLGRRADLGLLFTNIGLGQKAGSKKKTKVVLIDVPDLHMASGPPMVQGLVPSRSVTGSDVWAVAENFVQIGVTSDRQLLPLQGTTWQPPALLTPENLMQTREFREAMRRKTDAAIAKDQEPPSAIEVYNDVLIDGMLPFFGASATSDVVVWGRRAFAAFGGEQARVKRVGQVQQGAGFSQGRLVSPDPKQRLWATRKASMFRDVFGFVSSITRQLKSRPHGPRRLKRETWGAQAEEAATIPELTAALQAKAGLTPEQAAAVGVQFLRFGVAVPEDPSDSAQLRDALVELQQVVHGSPEMRVETGLLGQNLIEGRSEDEIDEATAFKASYLDEMARLNGRRPRKPRRPRQRARRNPLSQVGVDEAIAYTTSKRKEPEASPGLIEAFDQLREAQSPETWQITEERLGEVFPHKGGPKTWMPAERLPTLQKVDFISRVGALDPDSEVVRQGRASVFNEPEMPLEDPAVLALALAEAGLSLDEAAYIWKQQAGGRKATGYTMSPSAAICKKYRSVRLKSYIPPKQVLDAGGRDKLLILMSPPSSYFPRVMSFRRSTHIDCDMVGRGPEDLPELLGRAIQSAIYWLAERPKTRSADLYVGRVGSPYLYLALRAQEDLTLARVGENLRRAEEGETGYRIAIYDTANQAGRAASADPEAFMRALRDQLGPDKARVYGAESPEPGPVPPPEPGPVSTPEPVPVPMRRQRLRVPSGPEVEAVAARGASVSLTDEDWERGEG